MLIKRLPSKKSSKEIIYFVLYEKVDQWIYKPILKKINRLKNIQAKVLSGFSYDTYIKSHKIDNRKFPLVLAKNKIRFLYPECAQDKLFSYLIKEKFYSLETRVLLKQLDVTLEGLEKIIQRHNLKLFILPEDTDCLRGRLAAMIAKINNIKTLVILPLYYEWITAYPLMGKRLADGWVTLGKNYENRLLKNRINKKYIHKQQLSFKNKNLLRAGQKEDNLYETKIKRKKYYLATLQNNDCQDIFIQMLIDAFKLFPDKTLVFKFHPETPENDKKKLQNKYGSNNTYFLDKIDLNKLIYYSMGLLAVSSTCIFHAVKSKKPVVIIHVDYFFPELLPLIKQTGCFKIASTPPELVTIISKLDNAKQKKLYLSNQAIIKDLYFSKQCCPVKLIKKLTDRDK